MQKSKDAAFETLSDPKYSGKMKVSALLSGCIHTRMIFKIFISSVTGTPTNQNRYPIIQKRLAKEDWRSCVSIY